MFEVKTRSLQEPWAPSCGSCLGQKRRTDERSSHGATPMNTVDGNWASALSTAVPTLRKPYSGRTTTVPDPLNVKDVVLPQIQDTVPVPEADLFPKPNQASAGTWVR